MDVNETMEALGAKPMLDLLDKIGGWNVTTANWTNTHAPDWSLQQTLHKLHNGLNMGGLFSWSVGEDDRNSSRNIIQVGVEACAGGVSLLVSGSSRGSFRTCSVTCNKDAWDGGGDASWDTVFQTGGPGGAHPTHAFAASPPKANVGLAGPRWSRSARRTR